MQAFNKVKFLWYIGLLYLFLFVQEIHMLDLGIHLEALETYRWEMVLDECSP